MTRAPIRAWPPCWCHWSCASNGLTVLLTQRADHLNDHAGQVSFPGGRHEPFDADATATALREAQEEVGLDPSRVEILGALPDYLTGTGFRVTPVIGLVHPPFTLKADALEVAEVFEVPLAFLMNPANHEERVFRYEGGERRFFAMPYPRAASAQAEGREESAGRPLFHLGRDGGDAAQLLSFSRGVSRRDSRTVQLSGVCQRLRSVASDPVLSL